MGMTSWVEEFVIDLEYNIHQLLFCYLGMVYVTMCYKMKCIVVH